MGGPNHSWLKEYETKSQPKISQHHSITSISNKTSAMIENLKEKGKFLFFPHAHAFHYRYPPKKKSEKLREAEINASRYRNPQQK